MTDLFSLLLIASAGTAAGMLTGILPGIGPLSLLLLLYPWLSQFSVVELFVFYICVTGACQYYGSISAIVFGIPGEITSAPAAMHGHPLFLQGRGAELLAGTATASLIGAMIGVIIYLAATWNHDFLSIFLNNTPRLVMLVAVLILIVVANQHRAQAFVAVLVGILIGQIGLNEFNNSYVLSSTYFLPHGIPHVALFMGFLVIPELLLYWRSRTGADMTNLSARATWSERLKNLANSAVTLPALRGSVIGSLMGLVPSVGTSFSSLIAAKVESRRGTMTGSSIVLSAEAANNAASVTVLIPFVLLALPIVPSEAFLMSLAERQGFGINIAYHTLTTYLGLFTAIIMATNIFNWLLSGLFFNHLSRIFVWLNRCIYPVLIMLCIAVCAILGYNNNQLGVYLSVIALSTVLGCCVKHHPVRLALVFAVLLSDLLFAETYRFILLHS